MLFTPNPTKSGNVPENMLKSFRNSIRNRIPNKFDEVKTGLNANTKIRNVNSNRSATDGNQIRTLAG